MRHCLPLVLLLPALPLFWAEELPAQDKSKHETKAVRIDSADFLKPPAGLDAATFTVAQSPSPIDVAFFADLEERGKGTLWSTWGDGCLHSGGNYYTSIGDHLGKDATSYVYEYNPETGILRRVLDVLEAILQMLGLFGHGKIHAGLHEAADGSIYIATYWGKQKEVEAAFEKGYPGSILLRYDPKTGKAENLGAPVPKQGLPASNFDAARQLIYFHAVYKGDIAVYDIAARKVKFHGGAESSTAQRTFLADAKGRMFFSGPEGYLHYYDPETNKIARSKPQLPESAGARKDATLRAAARPGKSGVVYGMTAAGRLFALDPVKETIKDLGPNWAGGDYTAVMAISPDEKYLYYAPGAHGSGAKTGVPVVQYEIATGRRKSLAFLQAPLQEKLKYNIGGTYNLQIDPKGERLFFTFNGTAPNQRGVFGKPAVVVVHVNDKER